MVDRRKLTGSITDFAHVTSPRLQRLIDAFPLPDNFLGVEMEVEKAPRGRKESREVGGALKVVWTEGVPKGWMRVEDGSLRDNGAEFVFPDPVLGQDVVERLQSFEYWAYDNGVASSFRTSTHVHVDFSQERDKLYVIQDFLMAYYLLEELFFAYADPGRRHSGYCYAFADADDDLLGILMAKDHHALHAALQEHQRYYACNPASLLRHGTIEFRHLPLTIKATKVITWISLILGLKKFVLDTCTPTENLLEVIEKMGLNTFVHTVTEICPRIRPAFNEEVVRKRIEDLSAIYSGPGRVTNLSRKEVEQLYTNPIYLKITKSDEAPQQVPDDQLLVDLEVSASAPGLTRAEILALDPAVNEPERRAWETMRIAGIAVRVDWKQQARELGLVPTAPPPRLRNSGTIPNLRAQPRADEDRFTAEMERLRTNMGFARARTGASLFPEPEASSSTATEVSRPIPRRNDSF